MGDYVLTGVSPYCCGTGGFVYKTRSPDTVSEFIPAASSRDTGWHIPAYVWVGVGGVTSNALPCSTREPVVHVGMCDLREA